MRRCERRGVGGWPSLVSAALLVGCGTESPSLVAGTDAASTEMPAPTAADDMTAVRLDGMGRNASDPAPERRNPFRFGVATPVSDAGSDDEREPGPALAAPLAPSASAATGAFPAGMPEAGRAGVPLRFIGFMESPGIEGRVVVLTDGDMVFYGREGDVIDGRYRLVGIGLESVELERIDGRGAQTLSLPSDAPGGP